MLELDGIDVFYGEAQVLFEVSLRVGAGEVVALLADVCRTRARDAAVEKTGRHASGPP